MGIDTSETFEFEPAISTAVVADESFDPPRHLPVIAKAGFRIMELNLARGADADFDWNDHGKVQELKHVADDLGVAIWSVHVCTAPNHLACVDEAFRGEAVDVMKQTLDLAAELGAAVVPFHTGLAPHQIADGSRSREAFERSLDVFCGHARELTCVPGWENAPSGWVEFDPREIVASVRMRPADELGFVFDTGHANLEGAAADQYLPAIGDCLASVHLADNCGAEDEHLLPGDGEVDWPDTIARVKQCDYNGPVMLEVLRKGSSLESMLERAFSVACRLSKQLRG